MKLKWMMLLVLAFFFSYLPADRAWSAPDTPSELEPQDAGQFQVGDALRYGGLFGPLPDPEFSMFPDLFLLPFGGTDPGAPNSRDLGYGANLQGFEAQNRNICEDPLIC
jgi:hypothetical protein